MSIGSALRRRTVQPDLLLPGRKWHKRFIQVARPIDAMIAALLPPIRTAPPIFVIGPQRSGTTLFYKCLQQHHQLCYIDQACHYFPETFITASIWFKLIGVNRKDEFLQGWDMKKDLWIRTWMNHGYDYSEGNLLWSRLGPAGHWESEADRSWAKRVIPRMARRLSAYTRKPVFVNKCPANSLRIGQLLELFPEARFIHVQRDPRGVINSMVNIHRSLGVRSWGPMPVPDKELEGLSEYASVAMQWVGITQAAERGLEPVPATRRLTVRYEEFMKEPDATLAGVADAFGLEPFQERIAMSFKPERAGGWRKEMPKDEQDQVECILMEAGYGTWLTDE